MKSSVLILGDGSPSIDSIFESISTRFMSVVGPTLSHDIDLSFDEIKFYSAILIVPGDRFPPLPLGFQEVISEYVGQGGLLVSTPFLSWSVQHKQNQIIGEILPIHCEKFYEDVHAKWELTYLPMNGYTSGCDEVGEFIKPRVFEIPRCSGEHLRVKDGALIYAKDLVNNNPAIVSWAVGDGRVTYINLSHHSHEISKNYDVWRIPQLTDILFSLLGGSIGASSSLNFNGMSSADIIGDDFDGVIFTSLTYRSEASKNKYIWNKTNSSGLKHVSDFYGAHSNPIIFDDGKVEYGNDEYFEGPYGNPKKAYLDHIKLVPQNPFLYLNQDDYESMTYPEKIYVCRSLLRILNDDGHWQKVYRGIMNKPQGMSLSSKKMNQWKGKALEIFACYFFRTFPGARIINKNIRTATGEIDLMISIENIANNRINLGNPILIECKNTNNKIQSKDIRIFQSKIEEAGVKTGILVSKKRLTGNNSNNAMALISTIKKTSKINIIFLSFFELESMLRLHSPHTYLENIYYELFQA